MHSSQMVIPLLSEDNIKILKDLDNAIRKKPKNAKNWAERGQVNRQIGRREEAIQDCTEAIRLAPTYYLAWWMWIRGEAKRELGRYEEAIENYTKALNLNRNCYDVWAARGEVKLELKRYEEAIQDFNEAIRLNPTYYLTWWKRGVAYQALGQYSEALADLTQALKLNPNDARNHDQIKKALADVQASQSNLQINSQVKPTLEQSPPEKDTVLSIPAHLEKAAIAKSQLTFKRVLGEGNFGVVHEGSWHPTSLFEVPVAIKSLKNATLTARAQKEFLSEVSLQASFTCSSLVKLYGVTSEQPYCMVMEYMPKGSLREYLDDNPCESVSWDLRISWGKEVATGLAYLHQQTPPIIHRDIKSLNILLTSQLEAKLGDFGLSKAKSETVSQTYGAGKQKGPAGSLLWMAPELLSQLNAKGCPETDMYSYGVLLWEMASHAFPYEGAGGDVNRIRDGVIAGQRETFDAERTPNTPLVYQDITEQCWAQKPKDRLSAVAALKGLDNLVGVLGKNPKAPVLFPAQSPDSGQVALKLNPQSLKKSGINVKKTGSSNYLSSSDNTPQKRWSHDIKGTKSPEKQFSLEVPLDKSPVKKAAPLPKNFLANQYVAGASPKKALPPPPPEKQAKTASKTTAPPTMGNRYY